MVRWQTCNAEDVSSHPSGCGCHVVALVKPLIPVCTVRRECLWPVSSCDKHCIAKIVLNDSVLPSAIALRQLHWLPVKQRIHFKIATLTYRTLQSGSPSYLSSLINFNNPSRPLHSSSLNLLHVPFTAKAIGRKGFQFTAPTIWNTIPQNIRLLPSIGSFRRSLKTHLSFPLPD